MDLTLQNIPVSFKEDVLFGLGAIRKHLQAKYFYDSRGDYLFQQIMHCPEYYLTDCELEILSQQTTGIIDTCSQQINSFDIVELGPGDAFKSIFLLKQLVRQQASFTYIPIDISAHVINTLAEKLPSDIKGIKVNGLTGEYLKMLAQTKENKCASKNKLVLFLGSSLGNMSFDEGIIFLKKLKAMLQPGDLLLMGLDLVKQPEIILEAYNDKAGYTKSFNLNLLSRINKELEGNFKLERFAHFPVFDIQSKACKSYLISLMKQEVTVAGRIFSFEEQETIFMEISQKYDSESIRQMLEQTGFSLVHNFYDTKNWFVDTLWKA